MTPLDTHQLAQLLLSGPPRPLLIKTGTDSRDNPCYGYVVGTKETTADKLGADDLFEVVGIKGEVTVLRTENI